MNETVEVVVATVLLAGVSVVTTIAAVNLWRGDPETVDRVQRRIGASLGEGTAERLSRSVVPGAAFLWLVVAIMVAGLAGVAEMLWIVLTPSIALAWIAAFTTFAFGRPQFAMPERFRRDVKPR